MERLVLWDIDRTLVTFSGFGRDIFAAALNSVAGRVLAQMPDVAGKTDCELATTVLARHGITATDDILDAFYAAMAEAARGRASEMPSRGRALEGALAAVQAVEKQQGVIQSVVTGNIATVAELKLSTFNLAAYLDLDVGGYGSDHANRAVLVHLARRRAESKYGQPVAPHDTIVIGDTPHDIAGARANGVIAVGVASGCSSAGELEAAGADVVLPSLVDTHRVLAAVTADYSIREFQQRQRTSLETREPQA